MPHGLQKTDGMGIDPQFFLMALPYFLDEELKIMDSHISNSLNYSNLFCIVKLQITKNRNLLYLNDNEFNFTSYVNKYFTEAYTHLANMKHRIAFAFKKIIKYALLAILNRKRRYLEKQSLMNRLNETKKQSLIDLLNANNKKSLTDLLKETKEQLYIYKLVLRINQFLAPRLGKLNHYSARTLKLSKKRFKNTPLTQLPSICIVTPSYNHSKFIDRTITSVIDQNYPKLEYIVQDGGSTDGTTAILEKYNHRLTYWESVKDNGQSQAINLGFRHTQNEIMAYLNSDDVLTPHSLHYVGNYFAAHPDVDVVYSHRILIDENDGEIGRWILPPHDSGVLSWADYIPQETLFWRRSLWEKVGGQINENFRFAMDWELILRFREAKANFVRLPCFLGMFRIHTAQKTSAQISQVGVAEMQMLREHYSNQKVTHERIAQSTRSYLLRHQLYHFLYEAGILRY